MITKRSTYAEGKFKRAQERTKKKVIETLSKANNLTKQENIIAHVGSIEARQQENIRIFHLLHDAYLNGLEHDISISDDAIILDIVREAYSDLDEEHINQFKTTYNNVSALTKKRKSNLKVMVDQLNILD